MLNLNPRETSKRVTNGNRIKMTKRLYASDRDLFISLRFAFCFAFLLHTAKRKMTIADVQLPHTRLDPDPPKDGRMQGDCRVCCDDIFAAAFFDAVFR